MSEGNQQAGSGGPGQFVTTHWSAVIRAGNAESEQAQTDLAELCQAYWYPLYAFVRSRGHSPHDAEDLTQEFFARLLAKNYLADAKQEKGKFRTFLLVALKAFLANEWDRQHAKKRGGFQNLVSIDQDLAESRFGSEPADKLQPDLLFERQWAITLLERVMERLKKEYGETGRANLFETLRPCLTKDASALPYAEIGTRLGQTEPGVRSAVHRLRVRYRELLREEIGKTVATPDELEQEIRYLISILG